MLSALFAPEEVVCALVCVGAAVMYHLYLVKRWVPLYWGTFTSTIEVETKCQIQMQSRTSCQVRHNKPVNFFKTQLYQVVCAPNLALNGPRSTF